jgi:hypothetical protein
MATSLPAGFKPAFTRIQQEGDFDCIFACIAMLTKTNLKDVRQLAVDKFKLPKHGPYWVSETLIASLLAHHRLVATVYKEYDSNPLPDVAILMVDYDEETEMGRHALFHRASIPDTQGGIARQEYVVDPAYWVEPQKQLRADWKALKPAYWIGVHPMAAAPATKAV